MTQSETMVADLSGDLVRKGSVSEDQANKPFDWRDKYLIRAGFTVTLLMVNLATMPSAGAHQISPRDLMKDVNKALPDNFKKLYDVYAEHLAVIMKIQHTGGPQLS